VLLIKLFFAAHEMRLNPLDSIKTTVVTHRFRLIVEILKFLDITTKAKELALFIAISTVVPIDTIITNYHSSFMKQTCYYFK